MSSILRSIRLVGVTAAVAAGIAGFATVEASAPAEVVVVEAAKGGVPAQQACDNASDTARGKAFAHCRVIGDEGPIGGAPIFS
ncbi:UNVERIFIED_ORG: hypothetical protein E4P37_09965 [Bacillus sp. AZ43]